MNADAVRTRIEQRPFEPLEVELSSGQVYRIAHPEAVWLWRNPLVIGNPGDGRSYLVFGQPYHWHPWFRTISSMTAPREGRPHTWTVLP